MLNERRKQLVHMAFRILDLSGTGQVELDDIKGVYNASCHPDVMRNMRSEEEVLLEFMQAFQVGGVKDDIITKEEFENYYANLSASIDDDDYFELMIRNAWRISGGEGWSANTANRRVLVTHADGTQTVEEIKNDLGLRGDDKKGMVERLKAQGLKMASINTNGLEGMDNQYEDPEYTKYRQELVGGQGREQEQGHHYQSTEHSRVPSSQGELRNSLANFAGSSSKSGVGGAGAGNTAENGYGYGGNRPSSRSGPQRLADFAGVPSNTVGGPSSGYNAPVSAYRMQTRPASAAPVISKPTSLANFVNQSNNSAGGSSSRQRY